MLEFGLSALLRFLLQLVFIYMAYWSLQGLRFEKFFKANHQAQLQLFSLLCAIIVGYLSSSFFWEMMTVFKNFVAIFMNN